MKTDKASIIIPTFNKKERLQIVLAAFNHQSISTDKFEVVVVNDGSEQDGLFESVNNIRKNYTFRFINQDRKGRSAARNAGIAAAVHPLIIFCDDDTIPSRDYVLNHLISHDDERIVVHGRIFNLPFLKFFQDPATGTLYPEIRHKQENVTHLRKYILPDSGKDLFETISEQSRLTHLEQIIISVFKERIYPLQWLGFTGGNVSVQRKFIMEAGLFDESFGFKWGGEDLEMGYRLFLLGATFIDGSSAANYHISHYRCDFQSDLTTSMKLFNQKHENQAIAHLEKLLLGEIKNIKDFLTICEIHGS